ncbi:MAG: hypothetical protein J6O43_06830 [Clostridium sp.]|nr:hypothetical protein [Clostridium sp.]
MRRYQRYTVLFAALAVTGCLLACGGGASGQKPAEPPAKTAEAAGTEEKETVSESGEKKESAGAPMAQKKSGSGDKDGAEEKASLAERLEGRYSYAYPPAEDDAERLEEGEREYYTLELVNFGGNLFATGGIARTESPEEEKEAYSFWGMEMIPVTEGALLDRSADSCEVGILTWSVMSNLEKYWDRPAYGSIELTEDGVAFTGKDGADNPLMEGAARVEFVRDDTVPAELSANPEMLSEHDRGEIPEELYGVWKEENEYAPLVVEFAKAEGNAPEQTGLVRMYRKKDGQRVMFAVGAFCIQEGGIITCGYNQLGTIPNVETWIYTPEQENGKMSLSAEDEYGTVSGLSGEKKTFARITPEEIPLTGLWALEHADTSVSAYRKVLDTYRQAMEENWDQETMQSKEFYTGLASHGVPMSDGDGIGYVLYDIDQNGIDELLITWGGSVIDIWSFDGREAVLTYVTPYRGETVIYEDGMVECMFGAMTQASNTWYRMNEKTEQLLPVTERLYKPVDHGEPEMQYYVFAAAGEEEEFERLYEENHEWPVWAMEWGDEITKEEYEEMISRAAPVELSGIALKDYAGF